VSRGTDLLAQGRDLTVAAVGYLFPLGPDRLEPMELPHRTRPPRPPAGQAFRQAVRATSSVRGVLQLEAGGRGVVARKLANKTAPVAYRELRSDGIARRRRAAGMTPAKPTRSRLWLFAGDQSKEPLYPPPPRSLAQILGFVPAPAPTSSTTSATSTAYSLKPPCVGC